MFLPAFGLASQHIASQIQPLTADTPFTADVFHRFCHISLFD